MKKIKVRNIVFSAILASIVMLVSYAMLCPTIYLSEALSVSLSLPTTEEGRLLYGANRYVAVALSFLVTLTATFFIDKHFDISGKIKERLNKNYMQIIKHIIIFCGAIILGIIAEIIYRQIFGADLKGAMFNASSCAAFCAVFAVIATFIIQRKNLGDKPEKAVALIILILGTMIIVAQPFAHVCWDNDSHYPWALENSFFGDAYYTEPDNIIDMPAEPFLYNSSKGETNKETIDYFNNSGELYIRTKEVDFSLGHLPSGIFIAISRLFGANFLTRYLAGEFANVFLYTVICYFAIKKIKSGKMIMSIIALFPTNIFLAANYSYDWWVTAFGLLGTAYFVSELDQPDKKTTIIETIIMCSAFLLASIPKQIYVVLFALPLFMFKNYKDKKTRFNYYKILTIFFIITIILFAVRSIGVMGGTGDTRGGAVNPGEQLAYILGDPIGYAKMLIKFLRSYLSIETMISYVSNFAYLGTRGTASVFIVLLLWATFTDKEQENVTIKSLIIPQCVAFLLLIGGSALIATSMYIAFTPVGHSTVNGCQARYIIPLIAPMLLTLKLPSLSVSKNKIVYNATTLSLLAVSVWLSICLLIVKVMA